MVQILDGEGSGPHMGVTDEHRAKVESKSRPSEEVEAEEGDGFILHAECHTAAAGAGGLMYFTNDDNSSEIVITRIYFDPQVLTPTDLIITQVKKPTPTGGTDISSTGIIQKNYGSGKALDGTLVQSDGASNITYTGGEQYHSFGAKSMTSQTRDMKGTNVVTPNTTILWGWKSAAGATDGEIIALSVNCFKRPVT